jgi:hypothetical protein
LAQLWAQRPWPLPHACVRQLRERLELGDDEFTISVDGRPEGHFVTELDELPTQAAVRIERTIEAETALQIKHVNEVGETATPYTLAGGNPYGRRVGGAVPGDQWPDQGGYERLPPQRLGLCLEA